LHSWARALADLYLQEFKIILPSLNYPPILWKYVTAMSFPLETHSIAMRIANLLQLNEFQFIQETKGQKSGGYPDAKLMALLIVACKLGFNLEKTTVWTDWAMGTEEEQEKDKGLEYEDIGETDILVMPDEKLDGYMDWVQSKLLNERLEFTGMTFHIPI
jgi:hypothetical protein